MGEMALLKRTQAGDLAVALQHGYIDLQAVVEWADEQISETVEPDVRLIDLSLTSGPGEATGILRSISQDTDFWLILSHFLKRFYDVKTLKPQEALKLAKCLYELTTNEIAPKEFTALASHWDVIDLAMDGVMGDTNECTQNLLRDIRAAVQSKGGPEFDELYGR